MKRTRIGYLLSLLLFVSAGTGLAAPPRPLPELALRSVQSETVSGRDLVQESKWLLIFVSGGEGGDGRVLGALSHLAEGAGVDRVVVAVAGCSLPAMQELTVRHEKLADLRWLCDPERSAARALGLGGYPSILGMDGRLVAWSASGAAHDEPALRSLLADWVR